jgi:3-oxoadipate enol-lactonase
MLGYETRGSGIPLVLVHAFPLSRKMWYSTADALKSKFQVILPDLPGFGTSPRQTTPSVPDMAAKIGTLLEHLKIKEPVILGGLSLGGYVAFECVRQFPQKIRALGLFATRATPDSPEARENRFRSIDALEKFGMEPYAKKIIKSQTGKTTQEKHPEVLQAALTLMTANSREGSEDALKAMAGRRDSTDLFASLRIPTLIVAGDEDTLIPPADMESMHQKISGSEFHLVKQSGHLINLEQPEIFHTHFKNFLGKL